MCLLNCPCWPHVCYYPASTSHIGRVIAHTVPPRLAISAQIYTTFSTAALWRPLSSATYSYQILRCHIEGMPSSLIINLTQEYVLSPSQDALQLTTGVTGHVIWSRVGTSSLWSLSQEMRLQPLWWALNKFVQAYFKPTLSHMWSCVSTVSQTSVRG